MECTGSLSGFDFIFKNFALVLVVKWGIFMKGFLWVVAYLINEFEGAVNDLV